MLRVSIVIPVYNEAGFLAACLEAIARQSVAPFEVIVVDNNSTDGTADIAAAYPFVRLLREPRQGVVFARDRGFDAARGDIIGRLDADSRVSMNWVATVRRIMADRSVDAVSGSIEFYNIPMPRFCAAVDRVSRRLYAKFAGNEVALHGANMAIRRSAWSRIRTGACRVSHIHEDFDLAIHVFQTGGKVLLDESLVSAIAYRRIDSSFTDYARYMFIGPKTFQRHQVKSARLMYPLALLSISFYVPLRVLLGRDRRIISRIDPTQLPASG